jgi:hypothetical protein
MLGYGLVQVPLAVYNHYRTPLILSQIQFRLFQLHNEKIDIDDELKALVDDTSKLCSQIKYNDALRPCLEQIVRIIPEQYSNRIKLTMDDYEDFHASNASSQFVDRPTEKQLIKLHQSLKKSKHVYHRIHASWLHMIDQAFYYEDILINEQNTNRSFIKQSPLSRTWLRQTLFDQHPTIGELAGVRHALLHNIR